ncbi:oligosaccharide flippase family protein [Clostridium perfringens]|nr:oligosaccharide flippase family protein [Clostridium perfringens]
MNEKKELIKNTIIIAIGRFSTQVLTFILMPLYTYVLTTEEYGMYDFINTLALFLVPIITVLMEESMFRFLIDEKDKSGREKIISQAIIFITFTTVISIFIGVLIFLFEKDIFIIYFLLYLIASILMALSQAVARGLQQIILYSLSSFISGLIIIVLNIILILYLKLGARGLLLSFIISNIITSIYVMFKIEIHNYINLKEINFKQMKSMVKYSLPLVPNSISWVIINLSDRLIITSVIGLSSNGIYAVANKFPSIINTFYNFFYVAWKESAAKALKDEGVTEYYNSIYFALKRFLFGISICLISIIPFIFNLLIDSNYIEAYKYIPLLTISVLFSNISGFYGGIFSAHKDTNIMGKTTIYAAIINIFINILFIKRIGIYAAVISTLLSNLFVCIYRGIKIKRYINFNKDYIFYIQALSIFTFINIVYYLNNIEFYILGVGISVFFSIFINRNILSGILKFIKLKLRRSKYDM